MAGAKIDLSGNWTLKSSEWDQETIPANLPGDNYSALLAAKKIPDPYFGLNEHLVQEYRKQDWEYSRDFEVTEEMLSYQQIYLNAEMVDTFATFFINGKSVFSGKNMFARYRVDVKSALKVGTNHIAIRIKSAEVEAAKLASEQTFPVPMHSDCKVPHQNLIRKPHCHGGWDWGPTLLVCGIYAPLTLTGVNTARIEFLYADQHHGEDGVDLVAIAELLAETAGTLPVVFHFNGEERSVEATVHPGMNRVEANFHVDHPRLWWPNGLGEATLYPLSVETPDEVLEVQIGLRTIEIVNEKDEYGISMCFRVNGFEVFAKGADWIPADAFPERQTPEVLEKLLESAKLANMNMLRVWGGGQYEYEEFYRICDRKGLMIWQDMMFSCSLYPSTEEFIENVKEELSFQIPRLRHHACLALWCGDNEVIGATGWHEPEKRVAYLVNYDRLNRELGRMAAKLDPTRTFWPSSPCGGPGNFNDGWHDDSCGDMHYWEVWHGMKEFSAYYAVKPRFCSEFGYQSFPSLEEVKSFCPPDQLNIFSPVMDNHQKCPKGNTPIIGMFGKYFRMPEGTEDILYLSQVQQALAIKTAVEYWRSLKPRCMGTIFWALNNVWPTVSCASLEYSGKWKQLQYHARRFYQPVITAMHQDDTGNLQLYAVSDLRVRAEISVQAEVFDFDGKRLRNFNINGFLKPGECKLLKVFQAEVFQGMVPHESFMVISSITLGLDNTIHKHEDTYFFELYKRCELRRATIGIKVRSSGKQSCEIALSTDKPAFFVTLDAPGIPGIFSDNSFTLLPGRELELTFNSSREISAEELEQVLTLNYLHRPRD